MTFIDGYCSRFFCCCCCRVCMYACIAGGNGTDMRLVRCTRSCLQVLWFMSFAVLLGWWVSEIWPFRCYLLWSARGQSVGVWLRWGVWVCMGGCMLLAFRYTSFSLYSIKHTNVCELIASDSLVHTHTNTHSFTLLAANRHSGILWQANFRCSKTIRFCPLQICIWVDGGKALARRSTLRK